MKGKKGEEAGTAVAGNERGARSKAVRDYLAQNPKASPKEVVANLAAQGIEVSLGLVSVIKYSKKSGAKKSPGRKPGRPAASKTVRASAVVSGSAGVTLDTLIDAKQLVDKLGGLDQTISLLNKLAQLR